MRKPLQHRWHECDSERCGICRGGLALCVVCGGGEGSLLTYCPGFRVNEDVHDAVMVGQVRDLELYRQLRKARNEKRRRR